MDYTLLLQTLTTIAAWAGFAISVFSLFIALKIEFQKRFKIKISCEQPLLFDALETPCGNAYSFTTSISITNRSTNPIQINTISIQIPDTVYTSQFSLPYNAFLDIPNGDGFSRVSLKENILCDAKYLQPYETISARILFIVAGGNYKPCNNTVKLYINSSRGTKKVKIKADTLQYLLCNDKAL